VAALFYYRKWRAMQGAYNHLCDIYMNHQPSNAPETLATAPEGDTPANLVRNIASSPFASHVLQVSNIDSSGTSRFPVSGASEMESRRPTRPFDRSQVPDNLKCIYVPLLRPLFNRYPFRGALARTGVQDHHYPPNFQGAKFQMNITETLVAPFPCRSFRPITHERYKSQNDDFYFPCHGGCTYLIE